VFRPLSGLGAKENHMMRKVRLVVREAIEIVFVHLECLPPSERTELLRMWVQDCLRDAEQWSASPLSDRERDVFIKRVLALYVEVAKLERHVRFAGAKGLRCEPVN
jgi:hypothetical protein